MLRHSHFKNITTVQTPQLSLHKQASVPVQNFSDKQSAYIDCHSISVLEFISINTGCSNRTNKVYPQKCLT